MSWMPAYAGMTNEVSMLEPEDSISEIIMTRNMTVNVGSELQSYVESLVDTGDYKNTDEVLRESIRLLREKQADSKLSQLRHLIDEGENSGEPVSWDLTSFLKRMKKNLHAKK